MFDPNVLFLQQDSGFYFQLLAVDVCVLFHKFHIDLPSIYLTDKGGIIMCMSLHIIILSTMNKVIRQ